MARYFRLEEAQRLVPRVAEAITQAVHLKEEHDEADGALRAVGQRVSMSGGMIVDRSELLGIRSRRDASATRLREVIEEIHSLGAQVKDLEMGLVDFPSLYHGNEVLLCWRMGERTIEYWHGTDEGFRGRKRIDDEFRDNHSGGDGDA